MGGDWWAIDTAAWREAFAPFHKFASISERRSSPLPPWSDIDVEDFIKSNPVHGPRLRLLHSTLHHHILYLSCTRWLLVRFCSLHVVWSMLFQVRQGATIANVGALVGGLATAGLALKYSKNVPGAVGGFLVGAAMSWTIAEEGANLGLGLYKFNCMDTNLQFLAWWEKKHP